MSADYTLTQQALNDFDEIWRYSAETWSLEQADQTIDDLSETFALLTSMPHLARERTEFSPPVRIHIPQKHLVIYRVQNRAVTIIRILDGRQNWQSLLARVDGE